MPEMTNKQATADGYIKSTPIPRENVIKRIWKSIKPNFNWQIAHLATVYAALFISVTVLIYEQTIVKTLSTEQGVVRSKSSPESVQSASGVLYGKTPYFKFPYTNLQQIETLKEDFKEVGAKVKITSHQIIEINIPENPTGNLWQQCDNYGFKVEIIKSYQQFIVLPEPK